MKQQWFVLPVSPASYNKLYIFSGNRWIYTCESPDSQNAEGNWYKIGYGLIFLSSDAYESLELIITKL